MAKLHIPKANMTAPIESGAIEKAVKDSGGSSTKMYRIPVAKILRIPGFNVRVDSEDYIAHRDMLVNSIKANGFDETKPLTGYVGKDDKGENVIFVTDGHTRLDAVETFNADPDAKKEDEIDALPVVVRRDQPSMADLTVALHTNNTGRPLTPFELGVVVKRLLAEEDADKAEIARRLAVTPRYIDDVLLLADSPAKVRNHVLTGEVSSTMAIQELRRDPATAADRISAAVAKASAKGKKRATAKDVGPKLKRVTETMEVPVGTNMKELVKDVATKVREMIPVEGEGDDRVTVRVGEIKLVIGVEEEPKAKPKKKTPAKKKAAPKKAKPESEPEAENQAEPEADDLGIEGAEPADDAPPPEAEAEDEDLSLPSPPAVKSDEGTNDDNI